MLKSIIQEYAESLAALTGNDFQDEVCALLGNVIISFQTIPAKPSGDAGLDGISHGGDRAYCCYGPEHDTIKDNKERVQKIVDKFRSDLRRLFELDVVKGKLHCIENAELGTIIPDGKQLKHIDLIVNWFESHRVLNPIGTAVQKYVAVSKCRYIAADVSVVVRGPKQFATTYGADEGALARSRQRAFIHRVQQAAVGLTIANPRDFEGKMGRLKAIRPDRVQTIEALADQYLADWRMALAFDHELHDTLPGLHREFENDRRRILSGVLQLMLASNEPWKELGTVGTIALGILERDFGKLFGPLMQDVSSGVVARLIGECPIDWQEPEAGNAV